MSNRKRHIKGRGGPVGALDGCPTVLELHIESKPMQRRYVFVTGNLFIPQQVIRPSRFFMFTTNLPLKWCFPLAHPEQHGSFIFS